MLPEEYFLNILLQKHDHMEAKKDSILLFENNTSVIEAIKHFKNPHKDYSKDCLDLILFLKEEIKKNGFITEVILVVDDGKIKHVDYTVLLL